MHLSLSPTHSWVQERELSGSESPRLWKLWCRTGKQHARGQAKSKPADSHARAASRPACAAQNGTCPFQPSFERRSPSSPRQAPQGTGAPDLFSTQPSRFTPRAQSHSHAVCPSTGCLAGLLPAARNGAPWRCPAPPMAASHAGKGAANCARAHN